ncbi:MAG: aminoacyl-histidine dipeptidase [Veillonella sp.]|nr:aminoacyl-histidine dipeptidase [Veillonella sp.]
MESIVQAKRVLEIFKEMSQIPRESGNEKGISDYIVNFAKNLGLEVHQDDQFNVVIKKPASPGYENRPSIILQGHIDMVCVRDHDSNHDFSKDPIANIIEGEWMHADHTTLGADNGMGGAMMLAILEDDSQQHGPMQLLFTTNEETGMDGAFAIKEGQVSGDYLLNLDTEVEHDFTVSCAGGCHVHVNIPLLRENNQPGYDAGLSFTVTGLKGGHSGIEINEQRANANQVLTRVLYDIQQQYPVCLASFEGGVKHNAIPSKAVAVLSVRAEDVAAIKTLIAYQEKQYLHEYGIQDPGLTFVVEDVATPDVVYADDTTEALITYIYLAQDGVHSVSKSIPNLVETSNNIAIVRENEQFLAKKMILLAKTLGVSAERTGGYPAWEYDKGSKLEEQAISLHNEMFDTAANVNAIHAGLECGLLKGVLPNTQMISFGPTIVSPHTPMERVHLPSVENVYVYLKALLAKLQ